MIGVRDISLDNFFEQRVDVLKECRMLRSYSGFNGGDFVPIDGRSDRQRLHNSREEGCYAIPKREIEAWLYQNVGPRQGQVFKIDRVWWPDETPPKLDVAWQANADYYSSDIPRWNVVASIGYIADTIIMPDDQAVLFRMLFGGELIEL